MLAALSVCLTQAGLPLHGVCAYDALAGHERPCRAGDRLRAALAASPPRTVLVALFPYRFPADVPSNLARYARVPDYHRAAGAVLDQAASLLSARFPGHTFFPLIDNSPLPEVRAAALAGLGCVGDNGLLIHPVYGSYVVIGTLVTDLMVKLPPATVAECPHCGRCAAACPGGCLPGADRTGCVSHLTQKKGALTPEESARVRGSGMAWGCDRCQEVCPLNREALCAPHPCFAGDYLPSLTPAALDDASLAVRAYGWRGRAVIDRNLALLDDSTP